MVGRVIACESRIKELTKQLQPDALWQTIASKHENKLKEDMDSALQLMATKQDNKIQQEMDSALETKLKTVNKDITCTNETLLIVKQNAEEERLCESKACNLIIYNIPEPDNPNRTERQKHDEDVCLNVFNKILKVGVAGSDMKKNYAAWEIHCPWFCCSL